MAALLRAALLLLVVVVVGFNTEAGSETTSCNQCHETYLPIWDQPFHQMGERKNFLCSENALKCYTNCSGMEMRGALLKCKLWEAFKDFQTNCTSLPALQEKVEDCKAIASRTNHSSCQSCLYYSSCTVKALNSTCSLQGAAFGSKIFFVKADHCKKEYPDCGYGDE